jgi:hypothetical protein
MLHESLAVWQNQLRHDVKFLDFFGAFRHQLKNRELLRSEL